MLWFKLIHNFCKLYNITDIINSILKESAHNIYIYIIFMSDLVKLVLRETQPELFVT